jgi:NitT/TauT family transport system ATP-binding protein
VLSIKGLSKTFVDRDGRQVEALRDFDLEIVAGEFVAVLGPSGCGKTTMLRILQGLEERSAGSVSVDGRALDGPGRDRGFVFQQYGLLPWMTAGQNIAFALEAHGWPSAERDRVVDEALRKVGLTEFRHHYPRQMSGGMQQRVGIARALAVDPEILLLDEPFGALDALTREILQNEMLGLSESMAKTVVFVTHSIDEAITLADRVVVMTPRPGRIARIVEIGIERPRAGRGEAIRESDAFAHYRRGLWSLLVAGEVAA